MHFPTTIDMILLLVAFMWCTIQQLRIQHSGFTSVPRIVAQALYVCLMVTVVFYNGPNPGLSTTLFALSVASLGVAYAFHRKVPPRLPTEPRF